MKKIGRGGEKSNNKKMDVVCVWGGGGCVYMCVCVSQHIDVESELSFTWSMHVYDHNCKKSTEETIILLSICFY